jgi:ubiquinone/menaquinone biosynthesis C-methylase UbiE
MSLWYNLMVLEYKLRDRHNKPGEILRQFGIKPGFTVVDYGCGPGRYLEVASSLVGETGLVYAADISEVGIKHARKRVASLGLKNIITVLMEDKKIDIPDGCADVVYALDMFHLVDDPEPFLANIRRIVKQNSLFYLEDGHQPREQTLKKIEASSLWAIKSQNKDFVILQAL